MPLLIIAEGLLLGLILLFIIATIAPLIVLWALKVSKWVGLP